MISVIIPTYKGARFLKRAVDSALSQKDVEVEIIVVDDNSPESEGRASTEKCMDEYKDNSTIKYLRHLRNMNGSTARNTGIQEAVGEFISFLDDDDFYLPGRLKKCLDRLRETGADLIYTDVLITKNDIPSDYIDARCEGNLFKELWLNENIFGTGSNIFIRSEIIKKNGGFNETLPRQQDFEFLLRQFSNGVVASSVKECLVVKAMNGVNNSVSYEKLKSIKETLLELFDGILNSLEPEEKRDILIAQHKELLHCAAINKSRKGIKEQYQELSKIGYGLNCVERIKYILLKSNLREIAQNIEWSRRSRKIIKKHPETMEYIAILRKNEPEKKR